MCVYISKGVVFHLTGSCPQCKNDVLHKNHFFLSRMEKKQDYKVEHLLKASCNCKMYKTYSPY